MKRLFSTVLLAALAGGSMLVTPACVGGKQQVSAEDKQRLSPYILDAVPGDVKKVDINFENKIHMVGVKLEPALAPPGTTVKLTYYWRCDEPIEDGWQLFTHIQHEGHDKPDNLDTSGPLREVKGGRQVLGPDRWERGKVYADEQSFVMPADVTGPDTLVYVGIWKGDARLRIVSGPNDGDNRAIVGKVNTGVAPAKKEPGGKRGAADIPQLQVIKLAKGEKVVVDGKGDDAAWGAAASTGPFVDVGTGKPATGSPVQGTAKVAWDDEAVYFLVDVKDADVVGHFTNKEAQPKEWTATGQPKTWEKDTAEIMIDPDGDGDNVDYYEIQIGPQNRGFRSQFDGYNKPKGDDLVGPFGHEDWDPKLKSAVVVRGTMDKSDDKDDGYTVEVAIPWAAFKKGAKNLPPKPGDAWRLNFYAMENNGGTSWSPILGQGNFHKASRFGRITFVTKESLAAGADAGAGAADGGAPADAGASLGARDGGLGGGPALDGGRIRSLRPGSPN